MTYCRPGSRTYSGTLLTTVLLLAFSAGSQAQDLDVPYVSTPHFVVDRMLDMANVGPGDYLIDLGSGDGRIVTAAVMRGANGHGVDLDPHRVKEALANARKDHLHRRVMFLEQNVFDTDFSRATVVTMYLLPTINIKLRSKLLERLEPGSRIVSHNFDMDDWKPDNWESVKVRDRNHVIYFWTVPAAVDGIWASIIEGERFLIEIEQRFQVLDIEMYSGDNAYWHVDSSVLDGKRISFAANSKNTRYIFNGKIKEDEMEGIVQIYEGDNQRLAPWNAKRN